MNLVEFYRKVNEFIVKTEVSRAPPEHRKNGYLSSKVPKMVRNDPKVGFAGMAIGFARMAHHDGRGIRKGPP